jgi:uncharacterized protein (DUF2267 family)
MSAAPQYLSIEATPLSLAEEAAAAALDKWNEAQRIHDAAVTARAVLETDRDRAAAAEKTASENDLPDVETYTRRLRDTEDLLRRSTFRIGKLAADVEVARETWVASSEAVNVAQLDDTFIESAALADELSAQITVLRDTVSRYISKCGKVAGLLALLNRPGSVDRQRENVQRILREFITQEIGPVIEMRGGVSHSGEAIRSAPDLRTYYTNDRDGSYSPLHLIR